MIGLWTGNVRSTPTPKLTLRTVNASRTPSPAREITTPANTWIRDRFPSTTLTWTLTVSPGRKEGTSSRRDAESSSLISLLMRIFLAGATGHHACEVLKVITLRTIPLWQESRRVRTTAVKCAIPLVSGGNRQRARNPPQDAADGR